MTQVIYFYEILVARMLVYDAGFTNLPFTERIFAQKVDKQWLYGSIKNYSQYNLVHLIKKQQNWNLYTKVIIFKLFFFCEVNKINY
jgi:hypothetical protein